MQDALVPDSTPTVADGRRRRAASSHRRIVVAMLTLVRQGHVSPSADQVAAEAGVGRRTVFRLFRDMDGIYREMQQLVREAVAPVRAMPLVGDTPAERLHALVDRRSLFFEQVLPVSMAAAVHRPRSAMLRADHAAIQAELRAIMWPLLPPGHEADPLFGEAMDAVLSIDLWRRLRMDQQLEPAAATGLLHRLVDGLLATLATPQ